MPDGERDQATRRRLASTQCRPWREGVVSKNAESCTGHSSYWHQQPTPPLSEKVRKTHSQLRRAGYDSLWGVADLRVVRS
jgi:hypothetical protein